MNKYMKQIPLYGAITLLLLLICIWAFAGRIAKNYLEGLLIEYGAETAFIESITINPFALSIDVRNVKIQKRKYAPIGLEKAYINLSLFGLFKKEIQISKAAIQGISLELLQKGDRVEVSGFSPPPAEKSSQLPPENQDSGEWALKLVHTTLSKSNINVKVAGLYSRFKIEKFFVWDTLLSEKNVEGSFTFSGDMNSAEVKIDSTFGLHNKNGTASCKLTMKEVVLSDFQKLLPDSITALDGKLSINSKIEVDINNNIIELSQKGKGNLSDLKVGSTPYEAVNKYSDFQTDLLLIMKESTFKSARLIASLSSEEFQLKDADADFILMKWKTTSTEKMELSYKDILTLTLPAIETSMLTISSPPGKQEEKFPLLVAETFSVSNISFENSNMKIGSVIIDGMDSTVHLGKDKKLANLPELSKTQKMPEEKAIEQEKMPENGKPIESPGVRIDSFKITGDSRFNFIDESIDPTFKESFKIKKAEIAQLNNQKPDQDSPFVVDAEMKDYGKLEISGVIKPFATELFLKVTKKIAEYPLPDVSAYTRDAIGYNIKSGQLNSDTNLEINGNNLSGKTFFKIYAIHLLPHASDTTEKLTKQVTMPFNVAVGYISDKDGNLELEIPISGSLDDPSFGLSHFFQIIMIKAAKSAAYSAIKTTLLPYGALVQYGVDAALYAGEELMKLRLDPVKFKAGEVLPGKDADEYTKQLSELMKKEKEIRIIVCGISTLADRKMLKTKVANDQEIEKLLLDLAKQRADTFKEILVSHYDVPSSRILECQPSFDSDEKAMPRIEIEL